MIPRIVREGAAATVPALAACLALAACAGDSDGGEEPRTTSAAAGAFAAEASSLCEDTRERLADVAASAEAHVAAEASPDARLRGVAPFMRAQAAAIDELATQLAALGPPADDRVTVRLFIAGIRAEGETLLKIAETAGRGREPEPRTLTELYTDNRANAGHAESSGLVGCGLGDDGRPLPLIDLKRVLERGR